MDNAIQTPKVTSMDKIVLTLTCSKHKVDGREVICVQGDTEFETCVKDSGARHQIYQMIAREVTKDA